ncbi:MAG: hypothetical protein ILP12_00525 [Lachnospiraceae bacterium]|nr:hypothetical protein [Lachnospiraceae bacterium]
MENERIEETVGSWMQEIGLRDPAGAGIPAPLSFAGGGRWQREIRGVRTVQELKRLAAEAGEAGAIPDRVVIGKELSRMTEPEVEALAGAAAGYGLTAVFPLGEAVRDEVALREAVCCAVRAAGCGAGAFQVKSHSLLWLLGRARATGLLPAGVRFTFDAAAEAAGAKVLQDLGADAVIAAPGRKIGTLAALRAAVWIPLVCRIGGRGSAGSLARLSLLAEGIRIASPVILSFAWPKETPGESAPGLETQRLFRELARLKERIGR